MPLLYLSVLCVPLCKDIFDKSLFFDSPVPYPIQNIIYSLEYVIHNLLDSFREKPASYFAPCNVHELE